MDFGKQLGPLPMGAWVVVVGAGLGIAFYTRRQSQAAVPVSTTNGIDPNVGTGGTPGQWVDVNPNPASTATADVAITTNEQWGNAAIKWLIAQGYDPSVSDSAIRKYLVVDESRSVQEFVLQGLALGHLGPPPSPLPPQTTPPPSAPGPVATPPPPPPVVTPPPATAPARNPRGHPEMITPWPTKTSTLWGMAQKFYGNGAKWPVIYNANRDRISNPSVVHPGLWIWVPWTA